MGRFRFIALWALGSSGCVVDLGNLGELPAAPSATMPTIFEPVPGPVEAGAPAATPEPEPDPIAPAPLTPTTPVSPEPVGRGAFTLVHGVVDAAHGAFCVALVDDDSTRYSESALPEGGLDFGQAVVLPMGEQVSPASTEVQFYFVAAAEEQLAKGCSALLAEFGYPLPDSAERVELEVKTYAAEGAPSQADAGVPLGFPLLPGSRRLLPGSSLASGAGSSDAGAAGGGPVSAEPFDAGVSEPAGMRLDASAPSAAPDASVTTELPDASSSSELDAGAVLGSGEDAGTAFTLPAVRVAALGRLLPRTFDDLSYLVVSSGCLGGPGFDVERGLSLCGPTFEGTRSSFSAVVSPMSRLVSFDAVGLQVLHALQALSAVTVRSDPGILEGAYFTLATGLVTGGIQPFTAQRSLSVGELGEPLSEVLLSLTPYSNADSLLAIPWARALSPNGITLSDGRAYTLVLIGANPAEGEGSYWNAATFTAVESDPLSR